MGKTKISDGKVYIPTIFYVKKSNQWNLYKIDIIDIIFLK